MKALLILLGCAAFVAFILIGFAFPTKEVDKLRKAERDDLDTDYL